MLLTADHAKDGAVPVPVETPAPARSAIARPGTKAFYVLGLLCLISLLGYYDRYLMAILVEDIKHDLRISDGQVGLLTGMAFALVYSLLAVPVARFSDRGRRVLVLGVSLIVWSVMTALCGLAPGFLVLLLARLGVGIGEAGSIPTTHALVSDHFPDRWRATAIAAVTVVGGVGFMLANAGGGWIADNWDWRAAFLAGAAPAPLLAILFFATVREPQVSLEALSAPREGMFTAAGTLLARRSFALLCAGVAISTIAAAGLLNWIPAFLMREYALTAGKVGASYGMIMGLATIFALLMGGLLGDYLSRRDPRWGSWLPALCFASAMPLSLAFLFVHDLGLALVIAAPMTVLGTLGVTPAYALVQRLSGPRQRATGAAVYLLIVNLIGMGGGPTVVGWLSDMLAAEHGQDALKYALGYVSIAYVAGGALTACGAAFVAGDMVNAEQS